MKTRYPDVTFPPHWPQVVAPGYHNQTQLSQLEHDYSLAARNIYDVLSVEDTMDEVDNTSDNEEHGSSEEPHKEPIAPSLQRKTHAPMATAKPTGNASKDGTPQHNHANQPEPTHFPWMEPADIPN
jgi:hypothetical protein